VKIGTPVRIDCTLCSRSCKFYNGRTGWCTGTLSGGDIEIRGKDSLRCPSSSCVPVEGPCRLLPPKRREVAKQYIGLQAVDNKGNNLRVIGVACFGGPVYLLVKTDEPNVGALVSSSYDWQTDRLPTGSTPGHKWLSYVDCVDGEVVVHTSVEALPVEADGVVACAMALRERRRGSTRTEDQSWATGWSGRLF
jgi:hypothetical protein